MRVGRLAAGLVLCLERGAAAAGRLDVRVVDREARAHERVDEVDLGADEVRSAEGVDHDADTVDLDLVVPVLRSPVEAERVLEAGAAAALNGDPSTLTSPSGSCAMSSLILAAAFSVTVTILGLSVATPPPRNPPTL